MVEVASISNIGLAARTSVAEGKALWLQHLLKISSFHNIAERQPQIKQSQM
jgi:hypothetical protein